ncbi:detoxification of methylglyoxal, YhdN|nr:detoxification of methylglyoxal, YhdN [Candidatus Pantoea persica]
MPEALRSGYRLLKNAGFLPPELETRREALAFDELLRNMDPDDPRFGEQGKRLLELELALRQAGMNTDFLQGAYGEAVRSRLFKEH